MSTEAKVAIWDSSHPDGKKLLSESRDLDLLMEHSAQLMANIHLTEIFWNLLLECGVIDKAMLDKIKSLRSKKQQTLRLIDHVGESYRFQFHGFLWALVITGQSHCVKDLGYDVEDYLDNELLDKHLPLKCPSCSEFFIRAYILSGCGHYLCQTCIKVALFKVEEAGKEEATLICPLSDCALTTSHVCVKEEGDIIGLTRDETLEQLCQVVQEISNEGRATEDKEATPTSKEKVVKHLEQHQEKSAPVHASIKNAMHMIVVSVNEFKECVEKEKANVIKSVEEWETGQLQNWIDMKREANVKLGFSEQWQHVVDHLISMLTNSSKVNSTLLTGIEDALRNKQLSVKNRQLKKLMFGAHVSELLVSVQIQVMKSPMIVLGTRPPETANYVMEIKVDSPMDVAWTSSGNLLVLHNDMIREYEVNLCEKSAIGDRYWNLDNLSFAFSGRKPENYSLSSCQDGAWVSCSGNHLYFYAVSPAEKLEKLSYRQDNKKNRVYFNQREETYSSNIKFKPNILALTQNHLCAGSSHDIDIFSRQREFRFRQNLGGSAMCSLAAFDDICVATTKDDALHIVNLNSRNYVKTRERGIGEFLKSPQGVCIDPVSKHILVIDESAIWVYTSGGGFVGRLEVDMNRPGPKALAVMPRVGRKSLLAVAYSSDLLIFTLD